ncbi:MAG: ABC transporter ATP-binding protein [Alphaproteobacteria bacterium]|jgi:NitT/TauT family transport system ATP-binding protein|nr:ABC transporter ATP-binding protein [Alphaproteobacteria bacterium]
MAAIVELQGIAATFPGADKPVFSDIDLTIERGEFVIVVGASGAGKSTLLRVMAGLLAPSAGAITHRIETRPDRREISMVFQEARLMPWRKVADNVALGLEGLTVSGTERDQRIADALKLVGLADYGDRWAHELSGGQRQRVGIARGLAVDPDLLLMDEPFGALDAITRQSLQDELLRIWKETGKSILFVTHDIDEAVYLGDRVLLLGGAPARVVRTYNVDAARPRSREGEEVGRVGAQVKADLSTLFDEGGGI